MQCLRWKEVLDGADMIMIKSFGSGEYGVLLVLILLVLLVLVLVVVLLVVVLLLVGSNSSGALIGIIRLSSQYINLCCSLNCFTTFNPI